MTEANPQHRIKKAKVQFDMAVKPNPNISPNVFQTLLAIAALSDKDGVCRATREMINLARVKPVKQIDTITRHTIELAKQPWFHTSQFRKSTTTLNQHLISPPAFDVFQLIFQVTNSPNMIATLSRTPGVAKPQTTHGVSLKESDWVEPEDGLKPDGLPNVRPPGRPEEENKTEKLFKLLSQNIVPVFTRYHFQQLLAQYHILKVWKAWNLASKYEVENAQQLTGLFWLAIQDMLDEFLLSNLKKNYKKKHKTRKASNKAGAHKPPKSGQKSRDEAQISSDGHLDNGSRQADQDDEFVIEDVY